MAAQTDLGKTVPLQLSHRYLTIGEAVVELSGELDIASAEMAASYVSNVIEHCHRSVTLDLAALAFCDARGLAALVRMARYAEQKDTPFRIASPRPSLINIMRITGLDRRFLTPRRYHRVKCCHAEHISRRTPANTPAATTS